MPTKVEVYGQEGDDATQKARTLLDDKGVHYAFLDTARIRDANHEILSRGGRLKFPQVFINNRAVGSYADLLELERKGDLDEWLATTFQQY